MSNYSIRKVAVLGSGVMGSQIAAHCINAGLEVLLLDLKSDDPKRPNKVVEDSLQKISKLKPAPFALPKYVHRIKTGNFDDHFDQLSDADWICEVVIERMDIKQSMMERIEKVRKPGSIVSSNTSGLPITKIGEHVNPELKEHFLGTHFFNPPRYMKLLEVIPTPHTSADVLNYMGSFCEEVLGKGVVVCNDTPNFIANRIGIFSMASIMPYFFNGDFRAEEIDLLTGTFTGYSKAATFRTGDMAGLDIVAHVSSNLIPAIPDDERKEVFKLPEQFLKMVGEGKIGNKAGAGFYKKVQTAKGREFHVINPESLEYEPQQKVEDVVLAEAKKVRGKAARLKFLAGHDSHIGKFVWEVQRELLLYSANRVPEITDTPLSIDRAMKWGFNWEMGPFERWDALGVREVAERIEAEGLQVPAVVTEMLENGIESFYDKAADTVYNPITKAHEAISPEANGELKVAAISSEQTHVFSTPSATLHDIGDGVALFEFTTKQATLGFELVETLYNSFEYVQKGFNSLVISHDGEHFAYGANLMEAIEAKKSGDSSKVVQAVENFQKTALALRYQPFPVVVAPFGRTLGGGCEFALHADKVVAHHELYMGLVEVGVGLIPAGGGTKELLIRGMNKLEGEADPLPFIREAFKTIGMAKVSESAQMARGLNLLREKDTIVMNRDLLIAKAKQEALTLFNSGYQPPSKAMIKVLGQKSLSTMKLMLYIMHESKFITDYDKVVGERVAFVLAGGDLSEAQLVPEDYILKLEREAILECLEDERTHARIEHMLTTGKPLRN